MGGGGGGGEGEPEFQIAPMIDVLLVLLIIFMLIVPSSRKAIDVQLPDPTPAPASTQANPDQIVLEVMPKGQFSINKQPVTKDRLGARRLAVATRPSLPVRSRRVRRCRCTGSWRWNVAQLAPAGPAGTAVGRR